MKYIAQIFRYSIVLVAVGLLLFSCSTQKNTTTTRAYHNLTARYNYYFNANEIYKNSTRRASLSVSYNYTQPLPVLIIDQSNVKSMVEGDMDRVINKCTNLLARHSITVKPDRRDGSIRQRSAEFYNQNEFVRWAREAWLLIGKARGWKGSYSEASQTFEHILLQFPNTNIWHEAQVWMARIEIFNNDFLAAADRLRIISSNKNYPTKKYYTHLLESTWAEFYARQGNFKQALPHLYKALNNAPDKIHRTQYTFLLAQINQQQGQYAEAQRLYRRVIRMNPPYEMSFNARMNLAASGIGGGQGTDMKRQLLRMARDEKNIDYLDQLYYTLGTIEQSEGNIDKSIEYYLLSAHSSRFNNIQKGISYLALADYYFEKPQYTMAQAYYDSAYNSLDDSYPDFRAIEIKTLNLNKLVENLNIIQHQDSLLRIAAMPERERDAHIAALIREVRDEEDRLRREEQEERARFAQFQQTQRTRQDPSQGGNWYFYNQSALSLGQSDFRSRWGERRLEDNWRRRNKREVVDFSGLAESTTEEGAEDEKVLDNKSREYYLQHLPLNDSLKSIAHNRIVDAMLNVGDVYQKELNDLPEAINAYRRFLERYPDHKMAIEAHYNLYQINNYLNNQAEANRNKQQIISRYPTSHYAQLLSNPNFLNELREKERNELMAYEQTYNLYANQRYSEAIRQAQAAIEKSPNGVLAPKYMLIAALSTGRTSGVVAYRQSLQQLTEQYPQTEQSKTATSILEFLDRRELQFTASHTESTITADGEAPVAVASQIYNEPKGEHYFIALVPKQSPLNQLRFNIISFNVDYFIDLNLNVANQELNQFIEILTVEPFGTKEKSMEYYRKASSEEGLLGALDPSDYTLLVISKENFTKLLQQRSAVGYLDFFRTNYK